MFRQALTLSWTSVTSLLSHEAAGGPNWGESGHFNGKKRPSTQTDFTNEKIEWSQNRAQGMWQTPGLVDAVAQCGLRGSRPLGSVRFDICNVHLLYLRAGFLRSHGVAATQLRHHATLLNLVRERLCVMWAFVYFLLHIWDWLNRVLFCLWFWRLGCLRNMATASAQLLVRASCQFPTWSWWKGKSFLQ
jgi:hypothetical protein